MTTQSFEEMPSETLRIELWKGRDPNNNRALPAPSEALAPVADIRRRDWAALNRAKTVSRTSDNQARWGRTTRCLQLRGGTLNHTASDAELQAWRKSESGQSEKQTGRKWERMKGRDTQKHQDRNSESKRERERPKTNKQTKKK